MKKLLALLGLFVALLAAASAVSAADSSGEEKEPPLSPGLHRTVYEAQELMDEGPARALALLDRYAREHPAQRHYRLAFLRGFLSYQLGQLQRARQFFAEAAELWPCFGPAWQNLAAVESELNNPAAAARAMEKAHQLLRPSQPRLLFQAAVLWLEAQEAQKALSLLEELARNPRPETDWLIALAQTCVRLGKLARAEQVLCGLLERHAEREDLWRMASWVALARKDYAGAAAALEVACRLRPPEPAGWRQLGDLYRLARVPLKAGQSYRRAFGPHPAPEELDLLARTYLEGNELKQALETARQAATQAPSSARFALLGQIHLQDRNYTAALEAFNRAARLDDQNGQVHLMAGYAAWRLRKISEARLAFTRALSRAPKGSPTAKAAASGLDAVRQYRQTRGEAEAASLD